MTSYIQSTLYTKAPEYMDISEGEVCEKRNLLLENSLKEFESFPRSLNDPCKYFAVQLLMVQAEAKWLGIEDIKRIREARSICERAEEYAWHAPILKPMAVLETATYLKLEANEYYKRVSSKDKAEKLYERSLKRFEEVVTEYERRRMDTSTEGAKAYQGIAMVYICLANNFARDDYSSTKMKREERLHKAGTHYEEAFKSLELATRAFTVLNSASKLLLVKNIGLTAEALEQQVKALKKVKGPEKTDMIKRIEQRILQALVKAYNYFLTDPNHCDLKPGGPTYKRIHGIVDVLKKSEKYSPEKVQQVKQQLQIIHENFKRKEAGKKPEEVDTDATLTEQETADENNNASTSCSVM
ncbi:uncharacterized protein [Watersipora subatra]|uniref:uncharacterized protein n=1 Tax=Watersipora subatra TaxID=2589382 RepID=UPI00355AFEE0